ncbi:MAG: hypothetical protein ACRD9L_28715, partial [Bryobacteraceae bacterium]
MPDASSKDHESPLGTPAVQLQPKLACGIVVIQDRPLFYPLGGAFHPGSQLGHYNIGQQALFQKAQQLV